MPPLFTIGYEGQGIAPFCDTLLAHGVATVIDVRERPLSRKPDFGKKRLAAHLAAAGIGYLHLVELGTPKPIRDAVRRDKDYPAFFAAVTPLIEAQEAALQAALARALAEPCALLCYEAEAQTCHRLAVAEALARRAGGALELLHL